MSEQVITSLLFVELLDKQQQLIVGGADFELTNTNYAERVVISLDSTASSPLSNNSFSLSLNKSINTAAQNLLGFGGNIPENITALPPPPIL
ncbi:MAG TPA: CTB family bacteriocin [Nostocaceae cyanobacterium]|nr:CTB family bacteriocin [Nostocaceae cyanobacterium]